MKSQSELIKLAFQIEGLMTDLKTQEAVELLDALYSDGVAEACKIKVDTLTKTLNRKSITEATADKPKEKQIELGKLCGWKRDKDGMWCLITPTENRCFYEPPDFLNDLNAAQSAFQKLDENKKRRCIAWVILDLKKGQFLFDATAEQWCDGILKMFEHWQD